MAADLEEPTEHKVGTRVEPQREGDTGTSGKVWCRSIIFDMTQEQKTELKGDLEAVSQEEEIWGAFSRLVEILIRLVDQL